MAGKLSDIYQIDKDLWAIDEIGKDLMYLIDGGKRALLIDSGFGLLDLNAIAQELTPGRELIVVNSHAHPDHNSGNNQFAEVYCGRYDEPRAHDKATQRGIDMVKVNFFDGNPRMEGCDASAWQPGPAPRVIPLADGDVIDLGDTQLTVIETPGHTVGSISLHDSAHSRLFTGDMALTWPVWGQLDVSSALSVYQRSLERMASLGAQNVHPAHGVPDNPYGCPIWILPPRTLEVYARETLDIVEGRSIGKPYQSFGGNGLCVEFEIGGMVYNPDRIG